MQAAQRFANLHVHSGKALIIPCAEWSEEAAARLSAELAKALSEWSSFGLSPFGEYLGIILGPSVSRARKKRLLKFRARVSDIGNSGAPPHAASIDCNALAVS